MNHQAQKVVVVAYRRWSFTTGSNCKALTGKILVFWIDGRIIMGGGRIWRFDCIHIYLAGFLNTQAPNRPLPSNSFFFRPKNIV